ncbi:DUF2993 domain-containing protein [Corynebacterium durum]|uniref:LmeA family phospholipid-binding protein n=1 Tax=Corynebacterium durum TaxID=61592 RepID=UPI0028E76D52|nr:DUF2993 domain-containing protein [Corynebacterium durum]
MKLRRPAFIISSALALTFGIGWLVDSIVAARVEMRIAQEIEAVTPVESNPRIYVGGFPYLLALSTHKVPAITSESLDVRIPGLGLVNLRTEADRVTLSNEQLLNGNIEGAKAKALSHYMRLDGVALGSFLNITDLDISHPSDISPTSTSASEAQLTGTPPNFTEPVVAEVKLRIKGSTISIEPTSVRGAPPGREEEALNAFSWTVDSTELPLGGRATSINCNGGSIYISSEISNVTLSYKDFAPLLRENQEES